MTHRVRVEPSARKKIGRVKRGLLSARPPASVRGRPIGSPSHEPRREQTMRWPARAWARGASTALVLVAISVLACAQQRSSTASAQGLDTDARYFAETGFRIDNDRV